MLPTIFLLFFFFNFRIISKSILHNHSNSIRKLNYDRRKWANTFLFFFFSSCLFFFLELSCVTSFFLFFSCLPFFFLLGLRCSSFFGAGHFPFSFWGAPNLFFVFLFSFPCFLFSRALCFLSLSPSIAWTSRSEIDSSLFLAASLIVFVEPW